MFHNIMQHHFLCNIRNVVIAESMGKGLKCTTKILVAGCDSVVKVITVG